MTLLTRPALTCAGVHGPGLVAAFDSALDTLARNIVPGRTPQEPGLFIRAGAGYTEPWTRDAAINAWQAASLLVPHVARDTLLMVCDPDGSRVAQDDQWWDQVIWIAAAWQHVLVTGDEEFLRTAAGVARATLELARARRDDRTGLYRGPAVMQDGISGYGRDVVSEISAGDSFVLSHPASHALMCLSTNAVHVLALQSFAAMQDALGEDSSVARAEATSLAGSMGRLLRSPRTGCWGYHAHWDGDSLVIDDAQEALGWALAIMAGVGTPEDHRRMVAALHREPMGVVNVWPHLQDFDDAHPGRHNVMCWPMVMGVWAQAVAMVGAEGAFTRAVEDLIHLVERAGGRHEEVHHARTGEPDGGWQVGRHWRSEPDQAWSATTFIGTVLRGMLGMQPTAHGLRFTALVPEPFASLRIQGLPWRGAVLDIEVVGHGLVREIRLDGEVLDAERGVPHSITGAHVVTLLMDRGV